MENHIGNCVLVGGIPTYPSGGSNTWRYVLKYHMSGHRLQPYILFIIIYNHLHIYMLVPGLYQWPCNRDRLIGGTDSIYFWPIFQAYVREYPSKIQPYMILYGTVPPFQDPEIPIDRLFVLKICTVSRLETSSLFPLVIVFMFPRGNTHDKLQHSPTRSRSSGEFQASPCRYPDPSFRSGNGQAGRG